MDKDEILKKILLYAYAARQENPLEPKFMDMDFSENDLYATLGSNNAPEIRLAMGYLAGADKGYLEIRKIPEAGEYLFLGRITAKGIDYIEGHGAFNRVNTESEIESAEIDESLKRELLNLIKRIDGSLRQLTVLNTRIEELLKDEQIPAGVKKVLRPIAYVMGQAQACYIKALLEP